MRLLFPLFVTTGLFTMAASSSAQSPPPTATPATTASPSPSPARHHRHKKEDATAPTPVASPAASPVTTPDSTPASSPAKGKRTKEERAAAKKERMDKLAAMTPAPGGGAGMVWVNSRSKAYYDQSSPYYGKTKYGKYIPRLTRSRPATTKRSS